MADKTQKAKEVESTVEEVEKTKADKPIEEEETDKEESAENGDVKEVAKEKSKDKSKDDKEKNGEPEKEPEDKCNVKRKSTGGGDATDNKPADDATPEKKAKLDEPAEAESKGKAEVAA